MSLHRKTRTSRIDETTAAHAAEVLKAVAHPIRLRIVAELCEGDEHVSALVERLATPQPIVSQQLRVLRSLGLVAASRENGFSWYRLVEPALRDLVCCMEKCERRASGARREEPTWR